MLGALPTAARLPSRVLADSDVGKGSPIGLLVVLLLIVAVYFLYRSMNRHLRKVPPEFGRPDRPPEQQPSDQQPSGQQPSGDQHRPGEEQLDERQPPSELAADRPPPSELAADRPPPEEAGS